MQSKHIIHFKKLTKYYNKHIGIENLDFSIQRGDIFGFLGPNGSGKTTTIRLMLDLLKPSSGEVEIFGLKAHNNSIDIRKKIGYLPGDFSPYDKMSGEEFLKFSSRLRNLNYNSPKNLFDRFELSEKDLKKKIRAYSQGMKQKIGIIQAVVHEPELIILDEPSTGLDPIMQDALYDLLIKLQKKGTSIFFSSHNLPEVEKICQKVGIVKEGKLVGHESLESLRKKIKRKLKIRLINPTKSMPSIPGTEPLNHGNNWYEYIITGETMDVLSHLEKMEIDEIIIPEPSLEDIFLSYYSK